MMSRSQLFREWRGVPGTNALFQPLEFLDADPSSGIFITKQGRLCLAIRLTGRDWESHDDAARAEMSRHFELALRALDERVQVNQYLFKRQVVETPPEPTGPALARDLVAARNAFILKSPAYQIGLYVVLTHDGVARAGVSAIRHLRDRFSFQRTIALTMDAVEKARRDFMRMAQGFISHLIGMQAEALNQADTFALLRACVNYTDPGVRLKERQHLDYHMGDEGTTRVDGVLETVGTTPVHILSMKTAPAFASPCMFEALYATPGEFIICVRWRREYATGVRRSLRNIQNLYNTTGVGLLALLMNGGKSDAPLDQEKEALKSDVGETLGEMAMSQHFYGTLSMTVVCLGPDADRVAAVANRVIAQRDGSFIRESFGSLLAWLSIVPGNVDTDVRGLRMLEQHAADISSLFSVSNGERSKGFAGRGPIAIFQTESGVPYYFSPYVNDVGHRFTCGNIGSGKTTTEALLLGHVMQYDPQVFVLDFGQGYRRIGEYFGASYVEFGMSSTIAMNPLDYPDTREHRQFVHSFIKMLIEGSDGYQVKDAEDRKLAMALDAVMQPTYHRPNKRLTGVARMLGHPYNRRLEKWLTHERYGHLFDHEREEVGINKFQVWELAALKSESNREIKGPILSYLFRLADMAVSQGTRPVVVVLSEAQQFLTEPLIRHQVIRALDTWRKYDGSMILETQSIKQLTDVDPQTARTVVERCETMLFLPNSRIDQQAHRDLFGFHDRDIENLIGLKHKQAMLRRNGVSRVLDIGIDPATLPLYQSPVSQRTA
jgi:type IV secretion system protein VirB4